MPSGDNSSLCSSRQAQRRGRPCTSAWPASAWPASAWPVSARLRSTCGLGKHLPFKAERPVNRGMAGPTAPHQDGLLAGRSGHASGLCCSRLCPVTGRRAARLAPCAQFRGTQPRPVHRRLPLCVTQAHSGVTETLWPCRVDVCQPDTVRKLDPHGPPWAAQVPAAQGPRSLRPPRPREAQLGLCCS